MNPLTFFWIRVVEATAILALTITFILAMIGVFTTAQANEGFDTFALIGSYHTNDKEYCEFNPGIGISFTNMAKNTTSIMAYKNSECSLSVLASVSDPIGNSPIHWSVGAALGYKNSPFTPFVALTYHHKHFFIGATPLFEKEHGNDRIKQHGVVFYYGVKL